MDFDDLLKSGRIRIKRNRAIYDVAGLITETEARNLFKAAGKFVAMMRENLMRRI
jgi:hypothetical protein